MDLYRHCPKRSKSKSEFQFYRKMALFWSNWNFSPTDFGWKNVYKIIGENFQLEQLDQNSVIFR